MINFNAPAPVTDSALVVAMTLLQIAADPEGTKARIADLQQQEQAVRAAIVDHASAAAVAEQTKKDLEQHRSEIEKTKAEIEEHAKQIADQQLKIDVTNASQRERENQLAQREAAVTQAAADLDAERQAFEKLKSDFRSRLAG